MGSAASTRFSIGTLLVVAISTAGLSAQSPPLPIRALGPAAAVADSNFAAIVEVVTLANQLLVHDGANRRVVVLDSALRYRHAARVGATASDSSYGRIRGRLIRFRGDSALFVDPSTASMNVIAPSGAVARTIALPRPTDAGLLVTAEPPAMLGETRLAHRGPANVRRGGGVGTRDGAGAPGVTGFTDSATIVAVDFLSRGLDTLARYRTRTWRGSVMLDDPIAPVTLRSVNPLMAADDWTVLPDGAVAVIRGSDYHVDIVDINGRTEALPPVVFEWQTLTIAERERLIDTLNARQRARLARDSASRRGEPPLPIAEIVARQRRAQAGDLDVPGVVYQFVPADELPPTRPPFIPGATRADVDGNLWVRVLAPGLPSEAPVYDVINRRGERVERVRLPDGRRIVGFGQGRVYVAVADAAGRESLEAVIIR